MIGTQPIKQHSKSFCASTSSHLHRELFLVRVLSLALTNPFSHTLAASHWILFLLSHSPEPFSLSLSLSLSHTHTHTHTLTLSLSLTLSHSQALELSPSFPGSTSFGLGDSRETVARVGLDVEIGIASVRARADG